MEVPVPQQWQCWILNLLCYQWTPWVFILKITQHWDHWGFWPDSVPCGFRTTVHDALLSSFPWLLPVTTSPVHPVPFGPFHLQASHSSLTPSALDLWLTALGEDRENSAFKELVWPCQTHPSLMSAVLQGNLIRREKSIIYLHSPRDYSGNEKRQAGNLGLS